MDELPRGIWVAALVIGLLLLAYAGGCVLLGSGLFGWGGLLLWAGVPGLVGLVLVLLARKHVD